MRPSTPTLDAALAGSHAVARTITVRDATTDAVVLADVPIARGRVRDDLTDPLRWSASLEVADPSLLPRTPEDPLSGFAGTYLDIALGAVTAAGRELVTVARVIPERVGLVRDGEGQFVFTLDAVSGAAFVSTAWDSVLTALPGETVQDAVVRIVTDAMPWPVTVVDTTTPAALDPAWTFEGDPWTAARGLCEGVNIVCELDATTLTIRDPFLVGTPDLSWSTIDQILSLDTETGRGGGFANRVRVTFDTPNGPVVGDVTQTVGPLRYGGPAGRVTLRLDRPGPANPIGATLFAADLLRTTGAAWRTVGMDARPNPLVECGDTLRVITPTNTVDHLVTYTEWDMETAAMRLGVRTDADAA